MRVIGTAGHVDHGKSTLIAALTGTHPDRLKEEQAREMTIELGFAWLNLPGGETVGIVDVPGHRDFIENMLAGVGGIDAALFVVAADEGVMPQTREHLAILDLLQIPAGIIVLTKIDLIDDPEWLDLVEADVRQAVTGTVLEHAPRVRVSSRTRQGLDELVHILGEVLAQHPSRPDLGRPRLPVDRVFTRPGFGTVVTGTLSDGRLRTGEEVEILPEGVRGRIRGLQTHNQKEDTAIPGSRTAVNISGVDVEQVHRGDVVTYPGQYRTTSRLDVQFRLLQEASASIKHNLEVKFFLGAAETLARVRLLGREELPPGETGWLQLELQEPVVALRGDRYILRRPSPGETLGGGTVLNPQPAGRHKRFSESVIRQLETYQNGTPDELLLEACRSSGPAAAGEVIQRARLELNPGMEALQSLVAAGAILPLEKSHEKLRAEDWIIARSQWQALADQALDIVQSYHRALPLRRGMPREEMKSRLKLSARVFNALVSSWVQSGLLVENGKTISRPEHTIRLSASQQAKADQLFGHISANPYTPPSIKDMQADLGEEVFTALVELDQLVPVSPEVAFRKEDYDSLVSAVRGGLQGGGTITVAQFRDRYQTSRKYALAFLEHLDQVGITVRDGDARQLRQ